MSGAPWGGSEELWSQAALRLHSRGHHVSASVIGWPRPAPQVTNLRERGMEVWARPAGPVSLPNRVWRKVKKTCGGAPEESSWLRHSQPDLVVISQGYCQDGVAWMRLCMALNLPSVTIVHCNADTLWPSDESSLEMAAVYRAAKRVFCVSRHNLELLESQIGEPLANAQIVWNPFNVPSAEPTPWPAATTTWKLACVARLDPQAKGQDLLFHALSRPQWLDRPFELNLYGTGRCEQSLKRLMKKLNTQKVHFRGHTTDVPAIWQENHLLVLPSRYEGLPLALVEAMWCGRPAVVTDIGGNAELCVDGETGFVAGAPVVSLVAEALERAWDGRSAWQVMGEAASRRVRSLVPKDPVEDFCGELLRSAVGAPAAATSQSPLTSAVVPAEPML